MKLTERNREVLILLAQGATNREIAERTETSVDTAKRRVELLAKKTGARTRNEIVFHWLFGGDYKRVVEHIDNEINRKTERGAAADGSRAQHVSNSL